MPSFLLIFKRFQAHPNTLSLTHFHHVNENSPLVVVRGSPQEHDHEEDHTEKNVPVSRAWNEVQFAVMRNELSVAKECTGCATCRLGSDSSKGGDEEFVSSLQGTTLKF